MSTVTFSPPNAILFLFDRANSEVRIPTYSDGQLIASNDSCLSVGTQAAVDGDVTVTLETTPSDMNQLQRLFAGTMNAPSRKLAIVTAEAQTILEIEVGSSRPEIEVWTDDQRNPARIAVVAR
jgi:hypothetical protein